MSKKEVVGYIYQGIAEGGHDEVNGHEIRKEDGWRIDLDNWLDDYLSYAGVQKKIRLIVEFVEE